MRILITAAASLGYISHDLAGQRALGASAPDKNGDRVR